MRPFTRAARVLVLLAGCGAADFDVSQPVPEQRITGSPLGGILGPLFPIPVAIDIEEQIAARETGPIDGIHLSHLTLAITATAEGAGDVDEFGFIDRVDLFVESSQAGSSLERVRVAFATRPGEVRSFDFEIVPGINLLPYVNEGSQMTAQGEATVPPDDVTYDGEAVFRVNPL
jgi:hypothetical protein